VVFRERGQKSKLADLEEIVCQVDGLKKEHEDVAVIVRQIEEAVQVRGGGREGGGGGDLRERGREGETRDRGDIGRARERKRQETEEI
jgi:hypothetical protein